MPRSIIKSCRLNIKSSSLDDLIDAYLNQNVPTRQSVAQMCNVSASTSGKVANALVECGFAEQRLYADKNSRPALHLYIKEGLNVMVLDLSGSIYSMEIISPYGNCIFSYRHQYDAGISYEDNLNIFLSRGGYEAKLKQKSYYAISVIFADSPQNDFEAYINPSSYIPTMQDMAKTDRIISSVFKRHATYTKISDTVHAAVRFGTITAASEYFGVSYVFLGSYVCAFNVSHLGTIHSDIGSFITGNSTLSTLLHKRVDNDTLSSLLSQIVNVMHCAYVASSVVIDSDIYDIGEDILRKICRDCALAGVIPPNIIAAGSARSVTHTAASKIALSKFIRSMILSSNQK